MNNISGKNTAMFSGDTHSVSLYPPNEPYNSASDTTERYPVHLNNQESHSSLMNGFQNSSRGVQQEDKRIKIPLRSISPEQGLLFTRRNSNNMDENEQCLQRKEGAQASLVREENEILSQEHCGYGLDFGLPCVERYDDETMKDNKMVSQEDLAELTPDEVDRRSVYVGNVDYGSTPPELQEHFKNCGPINRITIMVDRFTGHPKGYAYIEFQEEASINNAVTLNESIFRDRPLKVVPKRKNIPGYTLTVKRGRGSLYGYTVPRGHYFKTGFRGRGAFHAPYFPRFRGGRGYRIKEPY